MRSLVNIIKGNRIALSLVGGALFIYFATPTIISILAGIPFILIGGAIRTWASGFIKKDKELAQEGPYAFTRNPLYLGNFFIGLGFCVMAYQFLLSALFLTGFSIVYTVTIKNEDRNLSGKFGDLYLEYKKKVPVFFPSLFRSHISITNFDWQLVKNHREYRTWLGITGCLLVFILKGIISLH